MQVGRGMFELVLNLPLLHCQHMNIHLIKVDITFQKLMTWKSICQAPYCIGLKALHFRRSDVFTLWHLNKNEESTAEYIRFQS